MPKNTILCCDGTSNQFAGDQTNVVLYRCAPTIPGRQVTFYDPGAGTMPAPGLPIAQPVIESWLVEQRIAETNSDIEAALANLAADGNVTTKVAVDDEISYWLNRKHAGSKRS